MAASDWHLSKQATYEDRAVVVEHEGESSRNIKSRRGYVVSEWKHAVAFVRTEWKEDVWNRRISESMDWDSTHGHEQQER